MDRSEAEIKRVLTRYGATEAGILTKATEVLLVFTVNKRQVQWAMPLPPKTAFQRDKAYDQEVRRRHRVLVITVKSLLEAIEAKILSFEQAFLPHLVVPDTGRTIGEVVIPRLGGPELPALLVSNPEAGA